MLLALLEEAFGALLCACGEEGGPSSSSSAGLRGLVVVIISISFGFLLSKVLGSRWKQLLQGLKDSGRSDIESHTDPEDPTTSGPSAAQTSDGPQAHSEEVQEMVPYHPVRYSDDESRQRALTFYELVNKRRTVRHFSSAPIPAGVIDNIIKAAGTSPSGAHTEPWHFVVVQDGDYKRQLREMIEEEERVNYERRMGNKWVSDLDRLRTNWEKEYIEKAPAIIIVLRSPYSYEASGEKKIHYYHELSTGISSGILVTAIHNAGLVTVTSTPMNAGGKIKKLFNRPSQEKVVLLLPVGYPAEDCEVPNLTRKPLKDIMSRF